MLFLSASIVSVSMTTVLLVVSVPSTPSFSLWFELEMCVGFDVCCSSSVSSSSSSSASSSSPSSSFCVDDVPVPPFEILILIPPRDGIVSGPIFLPTNPVAAVLLVLVLVLLRRIRHVPNSAASASTSITCLMMRSRRNMRVVKLIPHTSMIVTICVFSLISGEVRGTTFSFSFRINASI